MTGKDNIFNIFKDTFHVSAQFRQGHTVHSSEAFRQIRKETDKQRARLTDNKIEIRVTNLNRQKDAL